MHYRCFYRRILLFYLAAASLTACSFFNRRTSQKQVYTLMSYNTQTLFDAVEHGTEFAAFKGSKSKWSTQKYHTRLERLVKTVQLMGEKLSHQQTVPDIVVLQEIENAQVIEDFCKKLPADDSYPYALCCPAPEQQALTTALLSKYPIEHFYIHSLHVETADSAVRPLVEALINMGTKDNKQLLTVFSVHWKSKAREKSLESVRHLQEKQLVQKLAAHRAQHPDIPFIVCGDFNQPLEECTELQNIAVCWDTETYRTAVEEGLQPAGSYYFHNTWEKIDHIFYSKKGKDPSGIAVTAFIVPYDQPLVEHGAPVRYDVFNGSGYSDHLPIGIQFNL
ncbi:MAG: endonuclease/exonuclease/phosphatase family protein [Treponema sp.]